MSTKLNQENIENIQNKDAKQTSSGGRRILQEIQLDGDNNRSNSVVNFDKDTKEQQPEVISVSSWSDSTHTISSSTNSSPIRSTSSFKSSDDDENDDLDSTYGSNNKSDDDDDVFFDQSSSRQDGDEQLEHKQHDITVQEPDQISAELIHDIIKRSRVQTETSQLFIDTVYTVEMFNQIVYVIYKRIDESLVKIDFIRLLRSIFSSNNEHDELSKFLRMLLAILLKKSKNDTGIFSISTDRIDLDELSLLGAVILVMRSIHNRTKNLIFLDVVQNEINNIDSFGSMTVESKIKLCQRLVEYLGFELKDDSVSVAIVRFKRDLEHECYTVNKTIKELRNRELNSSVMSDIEQIREEKRRLEDYSKELNKQLKDLEPIEPFGRFLLDDESGDWISFWRFECLPGCLVLEQQTPIDVHKEFTVNETINEINTCFNSKWFLITDEKDLSQIQENSNRFFNYMFTQRMICLIRENRSCESRPFYDELAILQTWSKESKEAANDCSDLEKKKQIDDMFKSIMMKLIDLKERIVSKSMISYRIAFNDENRSLEVFEFEKEAIEKFESTLKAQDEQEDKMEKLKTLLESVQTMIFKSYLNKIEWANWKTTLNTAEIRTLSEFEMMLYVLSSNILWDHKQSTCNICHRLSTDTNNNAIQSKSEFLPIIECSNCHIAYHLQCVFNNKEQSEGRTMYNKSTRKNYISIVCEKCYQKWLQENNEEQIEINSDKQLALMINYGGRYSLRQNKSRIERALEEANNTASESTGSQFSDGQTKRRNPSRACKQEVKRSRGSSARRNRIIDDTEEEEGGEPIERRAKRQRSSKRNRVSEDTESEWEQKANKSSTSSSQSMQKENEEEIALRRARLGLRPRNQVHYS